jgi:hypothetical protein
MRGHHVQTLISTVDPTSEKLTKARSVGIYFPGPVALNTRTGARSSAAKAVAEDTSGTVKRSPGAFAIVARGDARAEADITFS